MGIDVLLSTKESALRIGQSPRTLEKWRVYGGGPRYLKIGAKVFYREKDLADFLESCVRTSTSDSPDRRAV